MTDASQDPRPAVGVGGVLLQDGKVLLIRRGKEPLRGRWTVPGGTVEWGESLQQALVREMREETGIVVRPTEILTVFDRIERGGGRTRYHFVIVDFLCDYVSGAAVAGSDALDVAFVRPDDLQAYDVPEKAQEVIRDAVRRLAAATEGALRQTPAASILK